MRKKGWIKDKFLFDKYLPMYFLHFIYIDNILQRIFSFRTVNLTTPRSTEERRRKKC